VLRFVLASTGFGSIPPGQSSYDLKYEFPSAASCLNGGDINIFAAWVHAHLAGVQMKIQVIMVRVRVYRSVRVRIRVEGK
jgi:hypothetical protein